MAAPGDRRPPSSSPASPVTPRATGADRLRPTSLGAALLEAGLVAGVSALAWAFLQGVLEFPGALAVAVLGGWLMGEVLWSVRAHPALAAVVAMLAWGGGLVLTWLMAMALLPGSARTFLERVQHTPLFDWLAPQLGVFEAVGLVLYVAAALFGARHRSG